VTRAGLVALLVLGGGGGCKKPTEGGVRLKQINDSFVSAGFKLDSFQPADPGRFSAQKCVAGSLDGVDTVVCEYGSAEAVTMGKKAGEDWVAQATTGAVLANGNTLLLVADRSRVDPNGKLIHKITQAYSKTR
jgi:hypothetical protein